MSWFTRRTTKTTAPKPSTTLSLTQLEAREVPAVLNLGQLGAQGIANGAIFAQYNSRSAANAGNGPVDSFLRLDDSGRERGYNTDARPLQFDESRNRNFTHSIKVSDLPLINIGGNTYRELVLDVNEPAGRRSRISLDELQIFVSSDPKLRGYNDRNDTLGGQRAAWTLGNNWVSIDAGLNRQNGTGDMLVAIPASAFGTNTDAFVALYSRFGVHQRSEGSYEQWGPGFSPSIPEGPTAQAVTISGFVYFDSDASGTLNAGDTLVNGVADPENPLTATLRINGQDVQTVNVSDIGSFAFDSVLFPAGSTYAVVLSGNLVGGDPNTGDAPTTDLSLSLLIAE